MNLQIEVHAAAGIRTVELSIEKQFAHIGKKY